MTGRRDRYGEPVEVENTDEHSCDRGWIERAGGRVARCPNCAPPETRLTERDWQTRVTDYATLHRWTWYHTRDSRQSRPGWPDLVLVRDGQLLFAELKTDTGRVTRDQQLWLDKLAACPGVTAHVWRPAHWPQIVATLSAQSGHRTSGHAAALHDPQDALALLDQLDSATVAHLDALTGEHPTGTPGKAHQ